MFGEGKLIEQELLGSTKKEKMQFGQVHELETEYLGYRPAMEYVKSHQRGDPYRPNRFFPKNLYESLRGDSELNINDEKQLAYYTAVGSALDRFHGVDAFFEYRSEKGKTIRVTIDVTTNPSKDNYKADVVLSIPSGGIDPSDENYRDLIEEYAHQIKEQILTKTY